MSWRNGSKLKKQAVTTGTASVRKYCNSYWKYWAVILAFIDESRTIEKPCNFLLFAFYSYLPCWYVSIGNVFYLFYSYFRVISALANRCWLIKMTYRNNQQPTVKENNSVICKYGTRLFQMIAYYIWGHLYVALTFRMFRQ